MSELRVGTSGWQYEHWRGRFYPRGLPKASWLGFYADHFDTVELNSPFYRQPERATFERWRRSVADGFVYAVKLNRFLTHIKRLNVPRESTARAYDTMSGLGHKLGPVLVQLPPRFRFDRDRVEAYFRSVSRRRRRHVIEPRDRTWFTEEALEVLRKLHVALCLVDADGQPTASDPLRAVTADLVYVRFHGRAERYGTDYTDDLLREWVELIRAWRRRGLDVFAYFNNDAHAHAPRNALRLLELAG